MGTYSPSINGVSIKEPDVFQISRFNLTKSGRLASGLMTMDFVAKKRKFFFTYNVISSKEMKKILDLIDTEEMFFLLGYYENGEYKEATCYVGEIPSEKFRTAPVGGLWYWKNFNFNLIEQ